MNKYLVEFTGTFFLMFTIAVVVLDQSLGNFSAIAIGLVLASMVYAGGHISGAHYNPAVTISFWLSGNFRKRDIAPYIISQTAAAVTASILAYLIIDAGTREAVQLNIIRALVSEFIFTFALVFVILNVAASSGTKGNSFYGIAIGSVVAAGVYSVGNVSGAVFNPAVAVGNTVIGVSGINNIWIYFLANITGGLLATYVFKKTDS